MWFYFDKDLYPFVKEDISLSTSIVEHGEEIRNIVEDGLKSKSVIAVNFSNVSINSPSFIDEAFAKLLLKHPIKEIGTMYLARQNRFILTSLHI